MKIPSVCSQCMVEDIASAKTPMALGFLEWRDDGRYDVTCPKGHQSVVILQNQLFELLYDIGAYAILDGYYREAVSSFSSSLERFYEFFIKVICIEKNLDEEQFQRAWKQISNQSERQLGAFVFLFLSEVEKSPKLLTQPNVKFRNDVIHKGKIPTRRQALGFGQEVLELIRSGLRELNYRCAQGIKKAVSQHLIKCQKMGKKGIPSSTAGVGTIISLTNKTPGHDKKTLEEAISEKNKWWEKES